MLNARGRQNERAQGGATYSEEPPTAKAERPGGLGAGKLSDSAASNRQQPSGRTRELLVKKTGGLITLRRFE